MYCPVECEALPNLYNRSSHILEDNIQEFWLVVKALANRFKIVKAFKRDIIKFAYWKRPAWRD